MARSRKSNEWVLKQNFQRAGSEPRAKKASGAPTPRAGALIGFVLLVVVVGLLGMALARVVHSAGIVAWRLSAWDALRISAILVTLRAIDRAVFGAIDRFGRDK